MAHLPPPLPAALAPAPRALGAAIAMGSAVAVACAVIVGLIGGVTNRQFGYGAVLLGVFTGQAVRRVRRDTHAAVAAALISLAGSALASLIGITTRLVRAAHIPLSVVLAHVSAVISIVPRAIGPFGFVCWALAAYAGWADVGRPPAGGGRRPARLDWARSAIPAGQIELIAGDPAAAERHLREGYEALRAMGERGLLSTITGRLAEAVYLQGRLDEAQQLTEEAQALAVNDDIDAQARWRATRAKLLAQRGQFPEARRLAAEAMAWPRKRLTRRSKPKCSWRRRRYHSLPEHPARPRKACGQHCRSMKTGTRHLSPSKPTPPSLDSLPNPAPTGLNALAASTPRQLPGTPEQRPRRVKQRNHGHSPS
jgi:hypothetical protein